MTLWNPELNVEIERGQMVRSGKRVGRIDSFGNGMVYIQWSDQKHVSAVECKKLGLRVLNRKPEIIT